MKGVKNTTAFIVLQGYVISVGNQCRINAQTAGMFDVKFKNNRLPDNVKIGAYITIIGKPITLDLGRATLVIKAKALRPGSLPKLKKFLEGEMQCQKPILPQKSST